MSREDEAADEADTPSTETRHYEGGSEIDRSQFPSLDEMLHEARRRYDDEENRRANIESKIGILATLDALVISLNGLFPSLTGWLLMTILLPALLSAALGLIAIRPKPHLRPAGDLGDFYGEARKSPDRQKDELLRDYIESTEKNAIHNDRKFRVFWVCIILTLLSLILVLVVPSVLAYLG